MPSSGAARWGSDSVGVADVCPSVCNVGPVQAKMNANSPSFLDVESVYGAGTGSLGEQF